MNGKSKARRGWEGLGPSAYVKGQRVFADKYGRPKKRGETGAREYLVRSVNSDGTPNLIRSNRFKFRGALRNRDIEKAVLEEEREANREKYPKLTTSLRKLRISKDLRKKLGMTKRPTHAGQKIYGKVKTE